VSARPERVRAAIRRLGDPYSIEASEGVGVFKPLEAAEAGAFLSDAEWAAAGRPVYLVYLEAEADVAPTGEIEWNGQTLTVLRVADQLLAGEVVTRLAVAA